MHGIIYPPDDPSERDTWREQLHQWRAVTRALMQYDDAIYRQPEYAWAQKVFALGLLMMWDEQFYDPKTGRYTIDALLDRAEADFGGYDAIMLWHAYPRIGLDDRNQFDFYRAAVGGLAGLRELVSRCHARGVKVYVDYNPWDTGTRREPDSDTEALADLVSSIDADAIFLDTMAFAADDLRARLDAAKPGVVLESEHLLPLEHLSTHSASWAQGLPQGETPGVLRNKWFERRHTQHRIKRWQTDHTEELHLAWMNGTGVVIWENVFGTPVLWSERDRSLLRSMLPIQRRYAQLFVGEGWSPLVQTHDRHVHASLWGGAGLQLWTLCNQSQVAYAGSLLDVPYRVGTRYFDLIRGEAIAAQLNGQEAVISGGLPPRDIGAVLAIEETQTDDEFHAFLEQQKQIYARASDDPTPPPRLERLRHVERTHRHAADALPEDMIPIPGCGFELKVQFRNRECGFYQTGELPTLDLRFHALHKPITFRRPVMVAPFAMDATPVTNAQFARFLKDTGYRPERPDNFLNHWLDGQLPTALEDHPVVYVDLEDMRTYARWAGKRLPTEEEWQHAAQGFEELTYPWGNTFSPEHCNHGAVSGTTPVTAFARGRSPFGCYDMCGNVWEMTESERSDGRTRSCVLKGGSYYRAYGSEWYMDGGPQPNAFSVKMILMWPGIDRCATVGFRCVVDLAE